MLPKSDCSRRGEWRGVARMTAGFAMRRTQIRLVSAGAGPIIRGNFCREESRERRVEIDRQRPVRVFRNWKHGCYSIMQDGRVCASASQVRLREVSFTVRESGRQRMLRGERRNVHAYAIGTLLEYVHPAQPASLPPLGGRRVYYDPYRFPTFVDAETHAPVTSAEYAQFDEAGASYLGTLCAEAA